MTLRALGNVLDTVDRTIVDELARDGRTTSTDLGRLANISTAAAAARVRRLIEQRKVQVTAVFDVQSAGFAWTALCYLKVRGRAIEDVAGELSAHPRIWHVSGLIGRMDLVACLVFVDKSELLETLNDWLPLVEGVSQIESDFDADGVWFRRSAYDVMLHRTGRPELSAAPVESLLPAPSVALDDLDLRIICLLRQDGRRSNTDIGRELDVSEGAVRQKIKRMQEARLLRIIAWIDPAALEQPTHVLWIRASLRGVRPRDIARTILELPQTSLAMPAIGGANLIILCTTWSQRETQQVMTNLRALEGVEDLELHEVANVYRMVGDLIRIPPENQQ